MDATVAINEANEELEAMAGAIVGTQSSEEIQTLLNDITQQLNQSIDNISASIRGQIPMAPQGNWQINPGQNARRYILPANTDVTIKDRNGQEITLKFKYLTDELNRKARQDSRPGNKYSLALNSLLQVNDPTQINQILISNNIEFRGNKISGGRRTRKK